MLCLINLCLAIQLMTSGVIPDQPATVGQLLNTQAFVFTAHNNLEGARFFDLRFGDTITYDGETYIVSETILLQALDPRNVYTDYINLESGERMDYLRAADQMLNRHGKLVLLTCYEKNGDPNWGRYFIIATPIKKPFN